MNIFEKNMYNEEKKIKLKIEVEEKEIREKEILEAEISHKTQSMDIESILNSLKRGDFILPKYQRRFVWAKEDVGKLILSLVKNIPIPPMYLYFQEDGRSVILDGQQRLTSIYMYFNDIFYKNEKERTKLNFKEISKELEKPTSKLEDNFNLELTNYFIKENNVTFKEMNDKTKRILLRKPLDVVFVQCNSEDPNKVYSDIFKLLNSAGKPLSNQEIRNGVFIDNILYDEIEKINENETWRKLYGTNSYIYRDFEYLLRFLSLNHYTKIENEKENEVKINYEENFDYASIIDDFSKKYERKKQNKKNKMSKKEIQEKNKEIEKQSALEKYKLQKFFDDIIIEGEKQHKKISILILEAIFVAYCKLKLYDKEIKISYDNFLMVLDNKDFAISRSTSSKSSVEARLKAAYKTLKEKYPC